MRKLSLLAAFLVASCAGIASAVDIPLYNTGVDNAGVPLADNAPDSHWSLVAPGAQTGAPLAVTGAGGFPIPPWLADNATSAWVGTLNPTALGPTNVTREYHYQTTFNMAGLDPKSAVIAGRSSQDNFLLDVLVNGKSTGIKESMTSFGGWSDFALDSTAIGNLTGGSNTMTFIVQSATENGTDDYTSLRVEFTQKTARPVPEPSAFALLGLSALGLIRRRR